MRHVTIGFAILLMMSVGACGAPESTAPTTSASADQPSAEATPTPTPAPKTKAEDAADVKKALVTAADLGKPWVKPKSVSRVGKSDEICPGHSSKVDKVRFTAGASTDLTKGRAAGVSIASYKVQTLPDEDTTSLVAAFAADQKACATYTDAVGFRVVRTSEGPTTVGDTEVVASWAERINYIKPRKLAYARHYVVVRQGRAVTTISLAFLPVKTDPKAEDFTEAVRLLQIQLDKNATVFR